MTIVICVAAVFGFAQSGRRAGEAPTPTPAVVTAASYSESKPLPPRQRLIPGSERASLPQKSSPKNKKDTSASQGTLTTTSGEEYIITISTDLVTVPVSVYDRNGMYVAGLQRSDFKVFEDGKEQEISYFAATETPFTVYLVIDTSFSTEYKISEIQQAAIAFIDQLQPQDKVGIIEFDGNITVLADATNDRQRLYKAIRKADFGYGTSLYRAVDFVLKKKLADVTGRKAVVLFTDGVNTTSNKYTFDATLDLAEESDTPFFVVYYDTFASVQRSSVSLASGTTAAEYAVGRKYLSDLSAYTGGRVYQPEAVPGGLQAAFESIALELRRQYSLGFTPADDARTGRRQIRVRVDRPGLTIRARDSYVAGGTQ